MDRYINATKLIVTLEGAIERAEREEPAGIEKLLAVTSMKYAKRLLEEASKTWINTLMQHTSLRESTKHLTPYGEKMEAYRTRKMSMNCYDSLACSIQLQAFQRKNSGRKMRRR